MDCGANPIMDANNALTLHVKRGAIVLRDSRSGRTWASLSPVASLRTGGDDWKPGRPVRQAILTLEETEGKVVGSICWKRGKGETKIPFCLKVRNDETVAEVGPAEGLRRRDLVELEFPRGLGWARAGQKGYQVLPIGMGALCDFSPSRKPRARELAIYSGGQTGLTMPIFGVFDGEDTLGCVVDTPFDCKIKTEMNHGRRRVYAQTPVWVIDERTNSVRRARFLSAGKAGYVGIAKRYRAELIRSGRFVTLREKARGNPEVDLTIGSLLGHRHLSFVEPPGADPYDGRNASGYFRSALRAGFDRVVAHDVLRGEPSQMADAARFAKSLSPGFRLSVYENYLDIFRPGEQKSTKDAKRYPDWDESLIVRERNGSMRRNFRVHRKGQRDIWTYTVCPARRLEVALPQMQKLLETLGRGSIYVDVEGAVPLFDCHDPRHPVTKEEDCRFRQALIAEVKKRFGVVSTEALPQDFLTPCVEVGSYFSTFPHSGYGNSSFRIMPPMIPIPLHPLVWHGCVLNQTGTGTNYYQSDPPHAALFGWLADTMDDKGRRIAYQLRDTAHAELLSHEFLTGPRVIVGPDDAFHCDDVQLTRFSDGTLVVGNFASVPYRWRGMTIPSMDFVILNERLSLKLVCPRQAPAGSRLQAQLTIRNTWDRRISGGSLALLGRGAAHSERPLSELQLPSLGPLETFNADSQIQAPAQPGTMWIVATVAVPDENPWQVTEIAQCEVIAG